MLHWLAPAAIAGEAVFILAQVVTLILCNSTDPGIIPRASEPPEDAPAGRVKRGPENVNGTSIPDRYCDTCQIYRPPRAKHCKICDNCVLKFDHHCPFMGTCIGERNYRYFVTFLALTAVNVCYAFAWSAFNIKLVVSGDELLEGGYPLASIVGSALLIVFLSCALCFMIPMCCVHLYFATTNATTNEDVKGTFRNTTNPFNEGCCRNWARLCCVLRSAALDFAAPATREERALRARRPDVHSDDSERSGSAASSF